LTSLSQNVQMPDWEVVIVVNDENIKGLLSGISGDVRIVEEKGDNLPLLYNKGAQESTGECLIFIKPGIVYFKGEGLAEAIKGGVAGIPIRNSDMSPFCLGMAFDFNAAPYRITTEGAAPNAEARMPEFVGGGLIGIGRGLFNSIGGFDEGVANHLAEVDFCLSAKEGGLPVRYLSHCMGFVFKETFVEVSGDQISDSDHEWKRKVRFFAKWVGKLPRDENFMLFAKDLLKV
jgi:hypothetical protein